MRHSVKRAFAAHASKKQRLFDYKIDSVPMITFLIAKQIACVPRNSKRTQGLPTFVSRAESFVSGTSLCEQNKFMSHRMGVLRSSRA
jgi:hypothetical protein